MHYLHEDEIALKSNMGGFHYRNEYLTLICE